MEKISERLDEFFSSYTPVLNKGLRENRVDRMRMLLSHLGSPEKSFVSIHIAGSKGKGTTASYMAAMLEKTGRRCGLYLSPHVYDVRERFTEATVFFPTELYEKTLEELKEKIRDYRFSEEYGPDRPTTFELYTTYSYLLFKNAGCDYAVIETGLGGRLDATNTIGSICSVITKIEKEHTNILGNTLTEIATEKAGIIRKSTDTFLLEQEEEVETVFRKECAKEKSDLHIFSFETKDLDFTKRRKTMDTTFGSRRYTLTLDTDDSVTILDAFYALYVLHRMNLLPESVSSFSFTDETFRLPARYEKRSYSFLPDTTTDLILDGAHTVESVRSTVATLLREQDNTGYKPMILIFSLAEDKDERHILKELLPFFQNMVVTTIGDFKKCNPERIVATAKEEFPEASVTYHPVPRRALERAVRRLGGEGTILVTGSFYLCNEIHKALEEMGYGR